MKKMTMTFQNKMAAWNKRLGSLSNEICQYWLTFGQETRVYEWAGLYGDPATGIAAHLSGTRHFKDGRRRQMSPVVSLTTPGCLGKHSCREDGYLTVTSKCFSLRDTLSLFQLPWTVVFLTERMEGTRWWSSLTRPFLLQRHLKFPSICTFKYDSDLQTIRASLL